MTTQLTNRREGGSTSCHSSSRKLRAFAKKELVTVRAAQELLGAPTIGRGSTQPRGGGIGLQRSQIILLYFFCTVHNNQHISKLGRGL
jgi:hypothetical protein